MTPATFETAWAEAEAAIMSVLVKATRTELNKTAFVGEPGIINAWWLDWGEITDNYSPLLASDLFVLHFPATLTGQYLSRADAQAWLMRLLASMPASLDTETNVANLRVRAVGNLAAEYVKIANEAKEVRVWVLDVKLDVVFETGGRQNAGA